MKWIEKNLLTHKRWRPKYKRLVSLLLSYLVISLVFYSFVKFVLPQLTDSLIGLVNDIPIYLYNTGVKITQAIHNLNLDPDMMNRLMEQWERFVQLAVNFITNLIPLLGSTIKGIASSVWNIVLGLIISVYILTDKENFAAMIRKLVTALVKPQTAQRIFTLTKRTDHIFGRFIVGKILDSLIITILTFIILKIANMPYEILLSVIIGITNVIPFFGPFFGAIPSIIIVAFVSPIQAFWLALIILFIQQVDGNIIGPKILGDSIGISAFWILFSLLLAGKVFGLVGMIIGVPLFAVIYSIVKEMVEHRLKQKGLPIKTSDYLK